MHAPPVDNFHVWLSHEDGYKDWVSEHATLPDTSIYAYLDSLDDAEVEELHKKYDEEFGGGVKDRDRDRDFGGS